MQKKKYTVEFSIEIEVEVPPAHDTDQILRAARYLFARFIDDTVKKKIASAFTSIIIKENT